MSHDQQVLLAGFLCTGYLAWVSCLLWGYWYRRHQPRSINHDVYLVAYASQTGSAKKLAEHYASELSVSASTLVVSLDELSVDTLKNVHRALFVVSTYGEGEPPDNGRRFYRDLLTHLELADSALLKCLSYSVVALGDKTYPQFCRFGEVLNDTLQALGASQTKPLQRIDSAGSQELFLSAQKHSCLHHTPSIWRIAARKQLNRGDSRPLVEVTLKSEHALPHWQAGDILDVQPHNSQQAIDQWLTQYQVASDAIVPVEGAPHSLRSLLQVRQLRAIRPGKDLTEQVMQLPLLPLRSYSVASVTEENALKLIVRQHMLSNGQPGLGSGWLTQHAGATDAFCGYLKDNPGCHIQTTHTPLLLIGAGSGIAGIRAQLAKRVAAKSAADVWVIYGEQTPDNDDVLTAVLDSFPNTTMRLSIDKAFSREGQRHYVQDVLAQKAASVCAYVERGAHIYVCGSYKGMGQAVHDTLQVILGETLHSALIEQHRYHRDTY